MSQLFRPRADAVFRFVLWTMLIGGLAGLVTAEGLAHSEYLLPLLPHHGGGRGERGDAAHPYLHDLPFPDLDRCADAGTRAGQSRE